MSAQLAFRVENRDAVVARATNRRSDTTREDTHRADADIAVSDTGSTSWW